MKLKLLEYEEEVLQPSRFNFFGHRHIVIFLLAVFIVGSSAGFVIAHCGHDNHRSGNDVEIEAGIDQVEQECVSHEHGLAAAEITSPRDIDHGANPVDCDDCSGVPCQSKVQVPEGAAPAKCGETDNIHSKNNIKIKPIYLTIIPDPPKQLDCHRG